MASIPREDASLPYIVAIDLGTSSARALIYDRHGRRIENLASQVPYRMKVTTDGGVEIAPDTLLEIVFQALDALHSKAHPLIGPGDIAAVALSTFWHAMMGVDRTGAAATPVYSWNDTRSSAAARELRKRLDEREVHSRTGCML